MDSHGHAPGGVACRDIAAALRFPLDASPVWRPLPESGGKLALLVRHHQPSERETGCARLWQGGFTNARTRRMCAGAVESDPLDSRRAGTGGIHEARDEAGCCNVGSQVGQGKPENHADVRENGRF